MTACCFKHRGFDLIQHITRTDQSEIDLVGTGTVTDFQIIAPGKLESYFFFQHRLPHPNDFVDPAFLLLASSGKLPENGKQMIPGHWLKFSRRARQQEKMWRSP